MQELRLEGRGLGSYLFNRAGHQQGADEVAVAGLVNSKRRTVIQGGLGRGSDGWG
jgi:hypothetical protein